MTTFQLISDNLILAGDINKISLININKFILDCYHK